jgi:hypothetical protein
MSSNKHEVINPLSTPLVPKSWGILKFGGHPQAPGRGILVRLHSLLAVSLYGCKLTLESGIQYNKEPLSKVGRECQNELINRRSYEENANMVFFHVWLLAADG